MACVPQFDTMHPSMTLGANFNDRNFRYLSGKYPQAYGNIATTKLIQRKTAEMRRNKPFYGFCGFMSEQDALFERLARERNITVEEMKEIISARILNGWNDTNPIK